MLPRNPRNDVSDQLITDNALRSLPRRLDYIGATFITAISIPSAGPAAFSLSLRSAATSAALLEENVNYVISRLVTANKWVRSC